MKKAPDPTKGARNMGAVGKVAVIVVMAVGVAAVAHLPLPRA